MLEVLRRIVQEVSAAQDLDEVLTIIVRQIKQAMTIDVVSIYLTDHERNQHLLMITDGLNLEKAGDVILASGEGLVGLVSQRAEPVNLGDAQEHPRFKNIPGTGEERFHSFLGVPIIHQRKVLGVLVVQRKANKAFSEESVAFLITLAAQLAGVIAHAEAGADGISLQHKQRPARERFVSGVAGAPGVGIGTCVVVYPHAELSSVPDRMIEDSKKEVALFRKAVSAVLAEIRNMQLRLKEVLPAEEQALFDAYALMLGDHSLVSEVVSLIKEGNWAQGALRQVIHRHIRTFESMEDDYLRERAEDLRELGRRVLMQLQEVKQEQREYPRRTILVGEEIGVTQLADVPHKRLAGVVSTRGSSSSHVAILARAMGIPAVMGAGDLTVSRLDGVDLIVDGFSGRIYVHPSAVVRREYARLAREETRLTKELDELRYLPAETTDGVHVSMLANTGLLSDITPSLRSGADGIGLYRTEFPFMIRERFPGEDEQYEIYSSVLGAFAPRPVTLRTLDVGGDKNLPYFPVVEENPFLGWRGIRITLDHPEIFLTQLRAMLRASVGKNNLNILLPMISHVSELDESLILLEQAFDELDEEMGGLEWPRVGAMIEVPSAVYQAEELIKRVDFLSVGTNDLTQYLLAVDRNNSRVAKLYDSLHPAVVRAVYQVTRAGEKYERPVSICGELAGDPAGAILLLGMGVDSLSMAAASLPRVKWVIRSFSRRRARNLLSKALEMEDANSIRNMLNGALEQAGLGALVRTGR